LINRYYSGWVTKFINRRVNSRIPAGVSSGSNLAATVRHVANMHILGRKLKAKAAVKSLGDVLARP
jgi:hypothetical protein